MTASWLDLAPKNCLPTIYLVPLLICPTVRTQDARHYPWYPLTVQPLVRFELALKTCSCKSVITSYIMPRLLIVPSDCPTVFACPILILETALPPTMTTFDTHWSPNHFCHSDFDPCTFPAVLPTNTDANAAAATTLVTVQLFLPVRYWSLKLLCRWRWLLSIPTDHPTSFDYPTLILSPSQLCCQANAQHYCHDYSWLQLSNLFCHVKLMLPCLHLILGPSDCKKFLSTWLYQLTVRPILDHFDFAWDTSFCNHICTFVTAIVLNEVLNYPVPTDCPTIWSIRHCPQDLFLELFTLLLWAPWWIPCATWSPQLVMFRLTLWPFDPSSSWNLNAWYCLLCNMPWSLVVPSV